MMPKLIIGCSSFYNRLWKDIFYPPEVPTKKWFEYYSTQFGSFEINSSFYKMPTVRSLKGWANRTPEDFTFSIKVPKEITHIRRLTDCTELLDEFYSVAREGLGDKLGCILFQFPPSFRYSEENLKLLIQSVRPGFEIAVEFRNETWWRQETNDALEATGVIFCTPSYPKLPFVFIKTSDTGFIRLHGDPRLFYSEYSKDFLQQMHAHIIETGWKKVYVYFNNTAGEAGILNAVDFKKVAGL